MMAIFAPLIAPADPLELDYHNILSPPSPGHWFGTDDLGRDILSRTIWGARESLRVAILASLIGISGGLGFGLISGYIGGWVDLIIQRVVEIMLAFPTILFVLSIVAALGANLTTILIAAGISTIPIYVRMIRSTVLVESEKDYVLASIALGATSIGVMRRHILPNVMSVAIVYTTLGLGGIIIATSGLSYVGLGAQPPSPEWGAMLTEGQRMIRNAWWPAFFPGLFIFIAVASINLFGEGLRTALDPQAN
jgi:peptide/nickel transport system permease protein